MKLTMPEPRPTTTSKKLFIDLKNALDDHQVCCMRQTSTMSAFIATREAVVRAVLELANEVGGEPAVLDARRAFGVEEPAHGGGTERPVKQQGKGKPQ